MDRHTMGPSGPGFSGFLPPVALIESLIRASREVAAIEEELPTLQSRNVSLEIRRIKLLLSLFEDVRDSGSPLPPSTVLCFTELFSVVRNTRSLIDGFRESSVLWNLLRTEPVALQFHCCAKELARALDILPMKLLGVSADVREQVELLHKQVRRAEVFVDPQELRLREELFKAMVEDHRVPASAPQGSKAEEILWAVGIRGLPDFEREIEKLEAEAGKQSGTGGLVAISNINNLISFISHCKSLFFQPYNVSAGPEARPSNRPAPAAAAVSSPSLNIPDEFRCPISLDLMKDPVIVASGHTYDRSSIALWINSGHHSCPKSGQKLIHMALIPNYALKSLISQWCKENNVDGDTGGGEVETAIDHISASRAAAEAVRMTAEFLVGKLAMGSQEIQRHAAYELRLLSKSGMDNRRIIAEAGAIPFLVTLLKSSDPLAQENAVTCLLNLSIFNNNKALIMEAGGAVEAIIEVLEMGSSMEARENAAATLFSLSMVDEFKVAIGSRPGAAKGLVGLLREGTAAGKKDAATALFNLGLYVGNRPAIVTEGAVPLLVGLLTDGDAGITDDALSVLAVLCGSEEGMKELRESRAAVGVLVELMRFGSAKGKENSITLLLGMCREGGEEMGRRLLMNPRSVPALQSLAAAGSPKASRKADALLRLLNRCCSQPHSLSTAATAVL